ncbi:MAG: ABC transporter permease [Chloroflexi bacterium]|nr:ABC transporter permease [Chloroflexota bacterium]
MTTAPGSLTATSAPDRDESPSRLRSWAGLLATSVGPIILAFIAAGILLAIIGRDPIAFYRDIAQASLFRASGLQDSITRMAPVMLIGAGLVVAFRGGLWNLGGDGQYLLGASLVAGLTPGFMTIMPWPVALILSAGIAILAGALWTIPAAMLKARYGLNEIVTTLMMSFIGVAIANMLVKGPFKGPQMVPQTAVIPPEWMLPSLFGTSIDLGVPLALILVIVVHLVLTRTSFGTRLDVLGANPRAAIHLGIDVPRLTIVAFMISGGLIGLAAFVDIAGVFGFMRSDWNPAYGLKVVPLVFLAHLNALAMIPLAAFFGILSIGGDYATRRADLPSDFLLVFMGLMFMFMVVTQYLAGSPDARRRWRPRARAATPSDADHGASDA